MKEKTEVTQNLTAIWEQPPRISVKDGLRNYPVGRNVQDRRGWQWKIRQRYPFPHLNVLTCLAVSRIKASSPSSDLILILDINSEVYPLQKDEIISLNLSSSLQLDGKEDKGWRELGKGERTLADDYDYVCYGKVYRFDEGVKGVDRV